MHESERTSHKKLVNISNGFIKKVTKYKFMFIENIFT